jgi:hypothetical protein
MNKKISKKRTESKEIAKNTRNLRKWKQNCNKKKAEAKAVRQRIL